MKVYCRFCGGIQNFDSVCAKSACRVENGARRLYLDWLLVMEFVSEVDEELFFSVEEAEWACYERDIDLRLQNFFLFRDGGFRLCSLWQKVL